MTTVVGLDLSLTGTGIARVTNDPVCPLDGAEVTSSGGRHDPRCIRAVCRYQGPGDTTPRVVTQVIGSAATGDGIAARADRLVPLAERITFACKGAALVAVERMAYSSNTGSVTDRAGLWWLVSARLTRGYHIPVADVVNNHIKQYAVGKGGGKGADKDAVLAETVRRYQQFVPALSNNNEADALQLAALAWHHLTGTALVELPETHLKALHAVKWPTR